MDPPPGIYALREAIAMLGEASLACSASRRGLHSCFTVTTPSHLNRLGSDVITPPSPAEGEARRLLKWNRRSFFFWILGCPHAAQLIVLGAHLAHDADEISKPHHPHSVTEKQQRSSQQQVISTPTQLSSPLTFFRNGTQPPAQHLGPSKIHRMIQTSASHDQLTEVSKASKKLSKRLGESPTLVPLDAERQGFHGPSDLPSLHAESATGASEDTLTSMSTSEATTPIGAQVTAASTTTPAGEVTDPTTSPIRLALSASDRPSSTAAPQDQVFSPTDVLSAFGEGGTARGMFSDEEEQEGAEEAVAVAIPDRASEEEDMIVRPPRAESPREEIPLVGEDQPNSLPL